MPSLNCIAPVGPTAPKLAPSTVNAPDTELYHRVPVTLGNGLVTWGVNCKYSGSIPPSTVNLPAIYTSPVAPEFGLYMKFDEPVTLFPL